jgi:hypothetical protein
MREIAFYEIVRIPGGPNAVVLGVENAHGVIVGISGEADERTYAVLIEGRTSMLDPSDFAPTGQSVDREAVYGGETIKVSPASYPSKDS